MTEINSQELQVLETRENAIDSISLETFKSINGIDKIDIMRGKGRMFADTVAGRLYFSSKVDLTKPLYIGKGARDSYWVFNTNVKHVKTV